MTLSHRGLRHLTRRLPRDPADLHRMAGIENTPVACCSAPSCRSGSARD